jgi:hypothetical protein
MQVLQMLESIIGGSNSPAAGSSQGIPDFTSGFGTPTNSDPWSMDPGSSDPGSSSPWSSGSQPCEQPQPCNACGSSQNGCPSSDGEPWGKSPGDCGFSNPKNDKAGEETVWGDPHITQKNGQQLDFTRSNGVFEDARGYHIVAKAPGAGQVANDFRIFAPGQTIGGVNPDDTTVYGNRADGSLYDAGKLSDFQSGSSQNLGKAVTKGQTITLPDGTVVSVDDGGILHIKDVGSMG